MQIPMWVFQSGIFVFGVGIAFILIASVTQRERIKVLKETISLLEGTLNNLDPLLNLLRDQYACDIIDSQGSVESTVTNHEIVKKDGKWILKFRHTTLRDFLCVSHGVIKVAGVEIAKAYPPFKGPYHMFCGDSYEVYYTLEK